MDDYEVAKELAAGLEVFKKYKPNKAQIQAVADFIYKSGERNLENLNDLVERMLFSQPEDMDSQRVTQLTPDNIMTSDFLVSKITHWVEQVRKEIFGQITPPFASLEDMEEWLLQQELGQREEMDEEEHHIGKAIHVLNNAGYMLEILYARLVVKDTTGYRQLEPLLLRSIDYPRSDGTSATIMVRGMPPDKECSHNPELRDVFVQSGSFNAIDWLESETRLMKEFTGFTQKSLLVFILLGHEPLVPRYKIKHSAVGIDIPGREIKSEYVTIRIRAKDLTFNELQEIYNASREKLKIKRGKAFGIKHYKIYTLVSQKGGPPQDRGRIISFWESVKREWNKEHPDDGGYETWKGIKAAYERIITGLEHRNP